MPAQNLTVGVEILTQEKSGDRTMAKRQKYPLGIIVSVDGSPAYIEGYDASEGLYEVGEYPGVKDWYEVTEAEIRPVDAGEYIKLLETESMQAHGRGGYGVELAAQLRTVRSPDRGLKVWSGLIPGRRRKAAPKRTPRKAKGGMKKKAHRPIKTDDYFRMSKKMLMEFAELDFPGARAELARREKKRAAKRKRR